VLDFSRKWCAVKSFWLYLSFACFVSLVRVGTIGPHNKWISRDLVARVRWKEVADRGNRPAGAAPGRARHFITINWIASTLLRPRFLASRVVNLWAQKRFYGGTNIYCYGNTVRCTWFVFGLECEVWQCCRIAVIMQQRTLLCSEEEWKDKEIEKRRQGRNVGWSTLGQCDVACRTGNSASGNPECSIPPCLINLFHKAEFLVSS
jgi:hypothetical protein